MGAGFINHYNNKYGQQYGPEWSEYSLLYIEFLVSIGLYNWFHPKFARTAPEAFQLQIADRLLHLLNFPNLVLDPDIDWSLNLQLIPTPVRGLPGYCHFSFNDEEMKEELHLPRLYEGDGWELHLLATGPYGPRRAMSGLVSTRETELMQARRAGELGSLTEYNELAKMLPQTTPVYYFIQKCRPNGYKETVFGPWPDKGVVVLKLSIASSHKTPTNRANLHTITLLFTQQPQQENPLMLLGHLQSLFGHHCTCKSGSSTNRACAHIIAALVGLCCPEVFESPKKRGSRLSDVHKPVSHRPMMPGPSPSGRHSSTSRSPAPTPKRRTPDTREKFKTRIYQNYPGR